MRYRRSPLRHVRADCSSDERWYETGEDHPGAIDVYEPDQPWQPTGLIFADGQPIERFVGVGPIGFLADIDE